MALESNGTTQVLQYADNAAWDAANFTMAFWLYQIAWTSTDGIASHANGSDTTKGWRLMQFGATDQFIWQQLNGTGQYGQTAVGDFPTGAWAHCAVVFDGGGAANADRLKIYKNGTSLTLTFSGTIAATLVDSTNVLSLMYEASGGGVGNIRLANFKWFSASLTAAQVKWEMDHYQPAKELNSSLVLWVPCDNANAIGEDLSDNAFTQSSGTTPTIADGPVGVSYGDDVINRPRNSRRMIDGRQRRNRFRRHSSKPALYQTGW